MQVTMQHAERLTLAAMGEFLEASSNLSFGGAGRKQIYGLLEGALHAQRYLGLSKKHKGIVHLYLVKISGLSKAQITRSCRLTDPADWPCLRRAGPREPEPLIFAAGFSAEHFRQKGYVAVDCVRRKIWRNESVERWYAQNILLFVRQDRLGDYPLLQSTYEKTSLSQLSVVHPRQLLKHQADVEERDEVIRGLQAELHLKVGECNEVIKDLHARLNEEIEARDKVISEMQAKLQLQQSEHTQAVARLREQLQSQTARSESVVADLWAQLGEILQSKTWRLIGAYMRLRQKLGGGARNAKTADRG